MVDKVAFTPDESLVAYRAIYEIDDDGIRKPQAIQTYRFSDGAHFVSSPSPLSGERQIRSFALGPASFRAPTCHKRPTMMTCTSSPPS